MSFLRILYRGLLSSCNYECTYCPFAKTSNTRNELLQDAKELSRFVDWVHSLHEPAGVFFTPWGEALIRQHYRDAMIRLASFENVARVAIQTNLTGRLEDFSDADINKIAFWATFHPSQTTELDFLKRCRYLERIGAKYSVGVVGLKENFQAIHRLRQQLSPEVYLWVNAFKRVAEYYDESELEFLRSIDPYFDINRRYHPSLNEDCEAGRKSFTVDGNGDIRRCHFVDRVLGNIYQNDIRDYLQKRSCPNQTCGCHIGYVNLSRLGLEKVYGENMLERIPYDWPNQDA